MHRTFSHAIAPQAILQSCPGGQATVLPFGQVALVQVMAHVPSGAHVPPFAAPQATGSQKRAASASASALAPSTLPSTFGPSREPSVNGASPASLVAGPISSQSSMPSTAAHAAAAMNAPESAANRAARAISLERGGFTTTYEPSMRPAGEASP